MARRRQVNRKIPQQAKQPNQKQAGFWVKQFAAIAVIIVAIIGCIGTVTAAILTGAAPVIVGKLLSSSTATISASTPTASATHSVGPPPTATFGFENDVEHWFAQEADLKPSKVDVTTDRVHSGSHALRR